MAEGKYDMTSGSDESEHENPIFIKYKGKLWEASRISLSIFNEYEETYGFFYMIEVTKESATISSSENMSFHIDSITRKHLISHPLEVGLREMEFPMEYKEGWFKLDNLEIGRMRHVKVLLESLGNQGKYESFEFRKHAGILDDIKGILKPVIKELEGCYGGEWGICIVRQGIFLLKK